MMWMRRALKMAWIMHPGHTIVSNIGRRADFSLGDISDGGVENHYNLTHA